MFLNEYSVRVIGGNEVAGGYVEMQHGNTFQLSLRNNNPRRCDARVELNGVHVGTWRINSNSSITLERPAAGDGKFTFYRVGTPEARAVQAPGGESAAGLVVVTFTPELVRQTVTWSYTSAISTFNYNTADSIVSKGISEDAPVAMAATPRSAGVIGQSGHSNQQYGTTGLIEYDYAGQTVISLRLVVTGTDDGPRPLAQRANPVPSPIR